MGRGIGMQQRPPMAGTGDWGMPRPNASPVGGPGHPGMGRSGMIGGPMINRSNSVPGNTRSMLQQQLMDMGMSHVHVNTCGHYRVACMPKWSIPFLLIMKVVVSFYPLMYKEWLKLI